MQKPLGHYRALKDRPQNLVSVTASLWAAGSLLSNVYEHYWRTLLEGLIWGIVIIGIPTLIPIVVLVLNYLEKVRLIEFARSAAESGHPVSADVIRALQGDPGAHGSRNRNFRRAAVLLSTALGFCLFGWGMYVMVSNTDWGGAVATGMGIASLGAIPGCIGLAYLALGLMAKPVSRDSLADRED